MFKVKDWQLFDHCSFLINSLLIMIKPLASATLDVLSVEFHSLWIIYQIVEIDLVAWLCSDITSFINPALIQEHCTTVVF